MESINDLKEQIQELATVMKSGNTSHKPNPPAIGRNPVKKFKKVNVKQNSATNAGTDAREGLTGPETNASGPFPPGQRPIQCHKCKGWGHVRQVCPSHLNYMGGGNARRRNTPPPSQEPVETQTSVSEGIQ